MISAIAEINMILTTYSVRKNEFKEVAEYTYLSQFVRGYMITIAEEFLGHDKTGRILVNHTNQKGIRTFCDIWERDPEKKLYFKFRNPTNCPFSDPYYIKDLEKEVEELREAGRKIQEQLPKHNERNAGRKKTDEKWTKSYLQWVALYEFQKPVKETMKIMGISKATYYRFKKVYNERE